MNSMKENAIAVMNELHQTIPYSDYCTVVEALQNMEALSDRDAELEELWTQFGDVPMNPETECIEEPFLGWGVGVSREEIWRWFGARHSKGFAYLLYGGAEDYVPETKRLYALKKNCIECESLDCCYNHNGECRLSLVHERKPNITEDSGCGDYNFKE